MRDATQRFMQANDASPVVAGRVNPKGGAIYTLHNGIKFNLGLATVRELPEDYPKWHLP